MQSLLKKYNIILLSVFLISCERDIKVYDVNNFTSDTSMFNFEPNYVLVNSPDGFPPIEIPSENPMTEEGILLGKKLFHDPILSKNNQQSCSNCHMQGFSFTEPSSVSFGVEGKPGFRNSMALVNIVWNKNQNWDGSAISLEEQALEPVTNPLEMNSESWSNVIQKLKKDSDYPRLFYEAFGVENFDSSHVAKAIAQFERTLISSNSKFDLFIRNEINLTTSELRGMEIYMTEKGDCFHCHSYPFLTDNDFHNNGLDPEPFLDKGRGNITGEIYDYGKFKTPSLRNVALTAPYMHDGRFNSLEEVVEHYNSGGIESSTIDPLMKFVGIGQGLTSQDKIDLINFMKTFTDTMFIQNVNFNNF